MSEPTDPDPALPSLLDVSTWAVDGRSDEPDPPPPSRWRLLAATIRTRTGSQRPVPSDDPVKLRLRQHAVALAEPGLRTLAGLALITLGLGLPWAVLYALLTARWARRSLGLGRQRAAVTGVAAVVVVAVLLPALGPGRQLAGALVLLGWLGWDVLLWRGDLLVATSKRIYRPYGVITQHTPSVALTGIAFIDSSVNPVGRLLHYGTLHLDSAAQDDAPLAKMRFIPNVVDVQKQILELRSQALPKFPPATG